MRRVLIIADDTTGANSSGILLKDLGYKCISVYTNVDMSEKAAYAVSTNSRAIEQQIAYDNVKAVLEHATEDMLLNKRIDSTIRGNLGSELNAFLDYFPNKKAVVVASFPNSGRTCVHDTLYVNGVSLKDTEIAKDPKMPVYTSSVTENFLKQSKYALSHVDLDVVRKGNLGNAISSVEERIIVIDAETNEDIEKIANTIKHLELDVITVDPGPFTYYYAKANKKEDSFVFHGLVGSVTDVTNSQLKFAIEQGCSVVNVDVVKLIQSKEYKFQILNDLVKVKNNNVILSTTDPSHHVRLDLGEFINDELLTIEDVSNRINQEVVELFMEYNRQKPASCIYSSGGDMTVEILKQSNATGMELLCEIIPLTVMSKIIGGVLEGTSLVSKGGLIGSDSTIIDIIKFVKEGK